MKCNAWGQKQWNANIITANPKYEDLSSYSAEKSSTVACPDHEKVKNVMQSEPKWIIYCLTDFFYLSINFL